MSSKSKLSVACGLAMAIALSGLAMPTAATAATTIHTITYDKNDSQNVPAGYGTKVYNTDSIYTQTGPSDGSNPPILSVAEVDALDTAHSWILPGYVFKGWTNQRKQTGGDVQCNGADSFVAGQSYSTNTPDLLLFACWGPATPKPLPTITNTNFTSPNTKAVLNPNGNTDVVWFFCHSAASTVGSDALLSTSPACASADATIAGTTGYVTGLAAGVAQWCQYYGTYTDTDSTVVTVYGTVADCKIPEATPPPVINPTYPPVVITTPSLNDGKVGNPYSQQLAATGGCDAPYAWALVSGALPAGLTMNASGLISGTPTVYGTFTITVSATHCNSANKAYTLVIKPADVNITTPSPLPNGTNNSPYSKTLEATGGCGAPYAWSLVSGALPEGLTLGADGSISGTPTKSGDYEFTVKAGSCSPAIYASKTYTLHIDALVVTKTLQGKFYFAGDSSKITSATENLVRKLVALVGLNATNVTIELRGFVAPTKVTNYDQKLAAARAAAVKALFAKYGITATYSIDAVGVDKGTSKKKARRVEAVINFDVTN